MTLFGGLESPWGGGGGGGGVCFFFFFFFPPPFSFFFCVDAGVLRLKRAFPPDSGGRMLLPRDIEVRDGAHLAGVDPVHQDTERFLALRALDQL